MPISHHECLVREVEKWKDKRWISPSFVWHGRSLRGRKYCTPLLLYPFKRKGKNIKDEGQT
jgi:hypothetical protein